VYAMRARWIMQMRDRRKAAGLGTTLTVGQGKGQEVYDLNDWFDVQTLMDMAGTVQPVQEAFRTGIEEMITGHPELRKLAYHRYFAGDQLSRRETRKFVRQLEQDPAALQRLAAPATAVTAKEEEIIDTRLEARKARPEYRIQQVEADFEAATLPLGKAMTELQLRMKQALMDLSEQMQNGTISLDGAVKAMKNFNAESLELLGTITALSSNDWVMKLIGAGMAVAGVAIDNFWSKGQQTVNGVPVLGDPFTPAPALPTTPRK
jgi:hypothetical protein